MYFTLIWEMWSRKPHKIGNSQNKILPKIRAVQYIRSTNSLAGKLPVLYDARPTVTTAKQGTRHATYFTHGTRQTADERNIYINKISKKKKKVINLLQWRIQGEGPGGSSLPPPQTVYSPLFFRKIATIARELRNGRHLCLYCERNGRQSTEGAGVGDGWTHEKIFFAHHSPELSCPRHPPPWWIVGLSPSCARNINKDRARFRVRVRSWRSFGKIEECKQSTSPFQTSPDFLIISRST